MLRYEALIVSSLLWGLYEPYSIHITDISRSLDLIHSLVHRAFSGCRLLGCCRTGYRSRGHCSSFLLVGRRLTDGSLNRLVIFSRNPLFIAMFGALDMPSPLSDIFGAIFGF